MAEFCRVYDSVSFARYPYLDSGRFYCKRRIFMEKFKYSLLVLFGACSYGVLSTIFKLGFINGFSAHQLLGGQYVFGWIGLLLLVLFVSRHKVTKAILFLTNSWHNDEYDRYLLRYFCRRTTSIYRCRPTFPVHMDWCRY